MTRYICWGRPVLFVNPRKCLGFTLAFLAGCHGSYIPLGRDINPILINYQHNPLLGYSISAHGVRTFTTLAARSGSSKLDLVTGFEILINTGSQTLLLTVLRLDPDRERALQV